ncbi:hypothetical protein ACI77O_12225 [Pseudomonas tritici]|uniref:hypothetical protein n=1 Tax=Pseudomonas tritici TaxID=2745518 RepID=UPI00387B396C
MGTQQITIALEDITEQAVFHNAAPMKQLTMMQKAGVAVVAIKAQVMAGRHICCAWSGGKTHPSLSQLH